MLLVVLSCGVVVVWGVVSFDIFVVEGVLLWVICMFCHVSVIMTAVFCVICSLLMFVVDASGDHNVQGYSSMGLVMALYVASNISFFPIWSR